MFWKQRDGRGVVEHWVVISGTSLRRRASVITFESFRGSLLEFYYSLLFVIYGYAGFCPFLLLFILFYERIKSYCIDKEVHNLLILFPSIYICGKISPSSIVLLKSSLL